MAGTTPRIVAALGVVLLPLYLWAAPSIGVWIYELMLATCVAALAFRARRERPETRGPWLWFALGLASWLVGDLLGIAIADGETSNLPTVVDAFYLAGYPLMMRSLAVAARLRQPQGDLVSYLDGAMVATALSIPVFLYWVIPAIRDERLETLGTVVSLAYPLMDLALVMFVVRFILGSGRWPLSTVIFLLGVICTIVADIAYNVGVIRGSYSQPGIIDLGWLAAFVLWTCNALMPANSGVMAAGSQPYGVGLRGRTWILAVIVAVPLVVVSVAFVEERAVATDLVIAPLAVIAVLMAIRLRLVAKRTDVAWQGPAILSVFALIIVAVAIGVARTNASGRDQAAAAARIEALNTAVDDGDRLVAWTLTVDPNLIASVAPRLYIARTRIIARAQTLAIPEAARIQREQSEWLSSAERQLTISLPTGNAEKVRASILSVVPLRDRLMADLVTTARKYRVAAAANARRGRLISVGLLLSALCALWLLMLRFGSVSRRADVAEERSRSTRESEDRIRALLGASADILTVVDPETRVLAHGDHVAEVLGLREAPDGLRLDAFLDADQAAETREALDGIAGQAGARARLEWAIRQPDGSTMQAEVSAVDHTADERIGGIVLSVRDITQRRRLEAALEHQALHDPLTGLANRALITDRLAQLFSQASGDTTEVHALVMLDLDDFRSVNDSFGHRQGDQLLSEVARRLAEHADPHDTLARVGGDGFAFLVENIDSLEEARERADLMLEAICTPIEVADGVEHLLRGSIGIALGDGHGDVTPQEQASLMFRDAELAMYEAKRQEGNSAEVFEPHMHDAVTQRLALRSEMVVALQRGEFVLHYQPIIDLRRRCIVGYEALVRWIHPERGMVSPGDFIPVAEQSGLIVELGDWVLREACRQLAEWQMGWADQRYVAVNVAGQQLERPDHLQRVREALEDAGLAPRQLLLEMTESSLIRDTDASIARLEALRGLGVRLAIDDFGTGYSSLNYLHRFAVDVIKIDKSFIDDVADEGRGRALVDAIVTMARRLGLAVVAEGIEDSEQVLPLTDMECEMAQGFHFSRPLRADAVLEFEMPEPIRRVA